MARTMAQKLGIKDGFAVLVIGAPVGCAESLGELPPGASLSNSGDGPFDAIHLFVANKAALDAAWPPSLARLKPGGLMWLAYPKKTSGVETDITRDLGWDVVKAAGWRPVTQVAIDETWSALRFRPEAEVGR